MKRRKLLKKIRRLHRRAETRTTGYYPTCAECGSPHPCQTYRLADGFTRW